MHDARTSFVCARCLFLRRRPPFVCLHEGNPCVVFSVVSTAFLFSFSQEAFSSAIDAPSFGHPSSRSWICRIVLFVAWVVGCLVVPPSASSLNFEGLNGHPASQRSIPPLPSPPYASRTSIPTRPFLCDTRSPFPPPVSSSPFPVEDHPVSFWQFLCVGGSISKGSATADGLGIRPGSWTI